MSKAKASLVAALAVAGALVTGAAQARDNVYWSIGINAPLDPYGASIGTTISNGPVYVRPAPVYYPAPPVYYAPPPVVYRPAPVYYVPPPVYVGGGYYDGWHHHRHHHRGWRGR